MDARRKPGRRLGPHWEASFALPQNGVDPVKSTTYHVDYQGVRFVVLDGTHAIDLGSLEVQAAWLDRVLGESKARWNIVMFHQPVFTCARPNDTAEIKRAWKPVLDRHHVDLVLQGHDHCYARVSDPRGKEAARRARAKGEAQGPVYVVSVTGSKMYGLNNRALKQPDRVAEDTQLYQVIDVQPAVLRFRTFTATGRLYDGFDLERRNDGRNRLVETRDPLVPLRTCVGKRGPDGLPCSARLK
jgi:3',5'-cyclic AMP phosphodiesterase CpdA